VLGVDGGGRVVEWNQAARRIFGYPDERIAGARCEVLFRDHRRVAELLGRAAVGEVIERAELKAVRADGMEVPVSVTIAGFGEGAGVCLVARDLTERVAVEAALSKSYELMTDAMRMSKVGFWAWDVRSDAVQMSDGLYRLYQLDPLGFDGRMESRLALVHPGDRPAVEAGLREALRSGSLELEYRVVGADGSVAWVHETAKAERSDDGRVIGLRGSCQDITERHRAAADIRRQAALMDLLRRMTVAANESSELTGALQRCVADILPLGPWQLGHAVLLGSDGGARRHVWLSDGSQIGAALRSAAERDGPGLVSEVAETAAPAWAAAFDPHRSPLARAAHEAGLRSCFSFPVVVEGRLVAVAELLACERREPDRQLMDTVVHGAIQLGRLVEREWSRHALAHQAMHDALTGLPNRSLFLDRLGHALPGIEPAGPGLAVMLVDLDDFKLINDSLGHDVGDRLLTAVARRLEALLAPGDTAARLGGDEFAVLCERLDEEEAVGEIANRILEAVSQPLDLNGDSTVVTASIGVAMATGPGCRPEDLVRDADAAMYRAKEAGRARFHVFDPGLHERAGRKLTIANELRRALANGELRLEYQPQFRLDNGELCGVEALARWENPLRGRLSPVEWIPVAEDTGLIVPIGEWILTEACRGAAGWLAAEPRLKICVNVSAVQLRRAELVDTVTAALRETGMPAPNLCLEITESVLMSDPSSYLEGLLGLKLLGVSLAVDDFGTGYSSLAYLKRLPVDLIKIDKAFVDGLGSGDGRDRPIVEAVVQMAEALGIDSVAEGVETAEQARVLAEVGCRAAQGFLFMAPERAEAVSRLVAAGGRAPCWPGADPVEARRGAKH
jgi:diguanylate cyclase (GGDEF)-like protein/PAS domain S-box-containing protein